MFRDMLINDLRAIAVDGVCGDFQDVGVTAPNADTSVNVRGKVNDIFEALDPDTGMLVSARNISVTFIIADLNTAGFVNLPISVSESISSKPWLIDIDNKRYHVHSSKPDRSMGIHTCILTAYR